MKNKFIVSKIISGGQTGADRGGLDAAIELCIPHGGWCPKGRKSEDGTIPAKYVLEEMNTADYLRRTEQNVIDSDATVIFIFGQPSGGSKRTVDFCKKHGKPYRCLDLAFMDDNKAASKLLEFLENRRGGLLAMPGGELPSVPGNPVLNIAGSRESKAQGIQERVRKTLLTAFSGKVYPEGSE
ncbi:MAG TPA: hypothetical protein DET40_04875 [Lentisphaeria bacterium]|nr:MAG: hypothetical protein A2X45_13450 [Lentisphaerae bacterium GWF2_50_93]HCE42859.1 hypothetical protein [Lentisphaeria bacterium]